MVAQTINLGSTQAPYWEYTKTLKENEHFKLDYVTDSFHLLDVSEPNALKVSFGGTMIQTPFTPGLGYRLTEPVEFIELWNDSNSEITAHFVVGVGDIKDSRLTVSGIVNVAAASTLPVTAASILPVQSVRLNNLVGGVSSVSQFFDVGGCDFNIMVTAGSVTIDISGESYAVSSLTLPEGAAWSCSLALPSKISVTAAGTYNYTIGY
ncbi:MAG: hypothetical protein IJ525_03720 [Alphaproteobacteria bacterium]|nr:hypothetical protein [Alphaproteobacteria bacterium]